MTAVDTYQAQAQAFLDRFGLEFKALAQPQAHSKPPPWATPGRGRLCRATKPPPWATPGWMGQHRWPTPGLSPWATPGQPHDVVPHAPCDQYEITLSRRTASGIAYPANGCSAGSIWFDFWGSINDHEQGNLPTAYDVLASLGGEPTQADEVYAEFGPMPPSDCERIAAFGRKLQAFFTEEELDALQEVA
jgi:hypothetical protein